MKRIAFLAPTIAIAISLLAHAVSIDLTPAQLTAICTSQGGCGAPSPTPTPPPPDPTPPPSGGITCPGFANVRLLDMNWASPARLLTENYGGFGASDIVVLRFTTGNDVSGSNLLKLSGAEFRGPPTQREAALSDHACDFVGLPYWGAHTGGSGGATTSVTMPFSVENPSVTAGFYPPLKRNTTYYLNVRMPAATGCGSDSGQCNMSFDLLKANNQ